MRLLFIGSIAGHKPGIGQKHGPADSEFLEAARVVGFEAARAGHQILLREVDSKNIVDGFVLKGAKDYCEANPGETAAVELHLPENVALKTDLSTPGLQHDVCIYPGFPQLSSMGYPGTYFDFLGATVWAINSADIVITMGDGQAVRIAGILSASGLTPTLAVACFGGSSKEVFDQNRSLYSSTLRDHSKYSVLTRPWEAGSASELIALAERFIGIGAADTPHTYFLSYSRQDTAVADHIELLLRRSGRRVLRDETDLRLGVRLQDAIAAMIAECNTFLAVGSRTYKKSEWCLRELSFAVGALGDGRAVYIDTDGSGLPKELDGYLGIEAASRAKRTNAVERIILEESDDKSSR